MALSSSRSSRRAACAHNHWGISLASIVIFQCVPWHIWQPPPPTNFCCFRTSGFSILDLYNDILCDCWSQPSPMLENITNLLCVLEPHCPQLSTPSSTRSLFPASGDEWSSFWLSSASKYNRTQCCLCAWFNEKVYWGIDMGLCRLGKYLTKWSTFPAFIGKFW